MSDEATPSVPAGWHPDPDEPMQMRYWDGTQWSDIGRSQRGIHPTVRTANPAPGATAGFNSADWPITRSVTVGGAALITLIGALAMYLKKYLPAVIVAWPTVALPGTNFNEVSRALDGDDEFVSATVGWGLIVAVIGGIATAIGSFLQMIEARADKKSRSTSVPGQ